MEAGRGGVIPQTHCRRVIPLGDGWPWGPGKGWGRLGPAGGLKAVPFTCLLVEATGQRRSWGVTGLFPKHTHGILHLPWVIF